MNEPSSTRRRADTLDSLTVPSPPKSTPATTSLASAANTAPDLDVVADKLTDNPTEREIGFPTWVPHNTPINTPPITSTNESRATLFNLPAIDETLEQLPPPATSISSDAPSDLSVSDDEESASDTMASTTHNNAVTEHSDLATEAELTVTRGLAHLAVLAPADHQRDPTETAKQHYHARLDDILSKQEHGLLPVTVSAQAFDQLRGLVVDMNATLGELMGARIKLGRDIESLKKEIAELKGALKEKAEKKAEA
ncbi:hypothetical protein LTR16_001542 [Cryomyces antarcticus]|uniref:Uncharacterized protein n=1 Tax=Cryomyces antarcticus TaxID=329879 RepID=A0ABR0M832_9PEZI|nr:hypothetical protein LTR39_001596 [Cryomyces antarcticus]KAK5293583.1 hypothetical protein LTR16_001542 [Cryomyces antarcticus]